MGTDLLFSLNTTTHGDYLGYKLIKIESILSIKIDKISTNRGVNVGGGGWFTPQRNDPVGLKLSAVGLKIMCLFTRGALQSKLSI